MHLEFLPGNEPDTDTQFSVPPEQITADRARSTMTRSFLGELYAGGESEFGVDVGEVGLHGAR